MDLSLPTKALEATIIISNNKQAVTIISDRNREQHLPKEADLEKAIIDTTTAQNTGNHKLTPTKNVVTQLT